VTAKSHHPCPLRHSFLASSRRRCLRACVTRRGATSHPPSRAVRLARSERWGRSGRLQRDHPLTCAPPAGDVAATSDRENLQSVLVIAATISLLDVCAPGRSLPTHPRSVVIFFFVKPSLRIVGTLPDVYIGTDACIARMVGARSTSRER